MEFLHQKAKFFIVHTTASRFQQTYGRICRYVLINGNRNPLVVRICRAPRFVIASKTYRVCRYVLIKGHDVVHVPVFIRFCLRLVEGVRRRKAVCRFQHYFACLIAVETCGVDRRELFFVKRLYNCLGGNNRACVIVLIKAVFFVRVLRCEYAKLKAVADRLVLIFVACVVTHLQYDCRYRLFTCKQRAVQRDDSVDKILERAVGRCVCYVFLRHRFRRVRHEIYVDHFRQLPNFAVRQYVELVLERKAAFVCDLYVLNVGVARFPVFVVVDSRSVIRLYVHPRTTKGIRPVHTEVQCTRLNDVVLAGRGVRKPRKRRAYEHRRAERHCQDTCNEIAFCR